MIIRKHNNQQKWKLLITHLIIIKVQITTIKNHTTTKIMISTIMVKVIMTKTIIMTKTNNMIIMLDILNVIF